MELGLRDRVVIVTGGASNIGLGIAVAFAHEGARVHIADFDDDQAARACEQVPDHMRWHHADVTDAAQVSRMVTDIVNAEGHIDVLVNNAGWTVDRLFIEQTREEWARLIDVEVWGWLNCTRAVLDHMIERRHGRIISIGSDAGRIGEWREVVHSGAKAAVSAMSKALAREVGRYGITVNVVSPGFTPGEASTSGARSAWSGEQGGQFTPDVLERIAKRYPVRRLGTPEDVAPIVLLLAADAASYVTGQTWSVSGGYTMV